jgi:hypothetical protein
VRNDNHRREKDHGLSSRLRPTILYGYPSQTRRRSAGTVRSYGAVASRAHGVVGPLGRPCLGLGKRSVEARCVGLEGSIAAKARVGLGSCPGSVASLLHRLMTTTCWDFRGYALANKGTKPGRSRDGSAIDRSRARRSTRPWRQIGSRTSGATDGVGRAATDSISTQRTSARPCRLCPELKINCCVAASEVIGRGGAKRPNGI